MDLTTQLCDKAEKYENNPDVELQWLMQVQLDLVLITLYSYLQATQKAQIHTNLLLTSDTKALKLCREQDTIISRFREAFPDLPVKEVCLFKLFLNSTKTFRSQLRT